MAISASSPCAKGYLVDTDARWNNLSMLCDDRTEEELGVVVSFRMLFNQSDFYLKKIFKNINFHVLSCKVMMSSGFKLT